MSADQPFRSALSLGERRRLFARTKFRGGSASPLAKERTERCKRWFTHSDSSRWPRFLKRLRLDEERLLQLAAPTLAIDSARLPAWALTLSELLRWLESNPCPARDDLSLAQNLAVPVIGYAWEKANSVLSHKHLRHFTPVAAAAWKQGLVRRLARSVEGITRWEWPTNAAVEKNKTLPFPKEELAGETYEILCSYPGLSRLWARQIEGWLDLTGELLQAANGFLRDRSLQIRDGGEITGIEPDLSDLHEGQRATAKIALRNGQHWFFKPRSGEHELGWFNLLGWLREEGCPYSFIRPEVIVHQRHCWMKSVLPRTCRNHQAVTTYFRRAGALLHLAERLQAADLHAGNLVAQGEHPVLVDCETLRHPVTRVPRFGRTDIHRILGSGLLPINGKLSSRDSLSALGRRTVGPHRASLAGTPVETFAFVEELERGYRAMHQFLGSPLLVRLFPSKVEQFLPANVRRILRPTAYYEEILERSWAPRTMMDSFDRSLFLEAACDDGSVPNNRIAGEVKALEDGEIPLFRGKAASLGQRLSKTGLTKSIELMRNSFDPEKREAC